MSIGPSPSDPQAVLDQEPKRLLSVDDYHRMIAAGVFDPDEHTGAGEYRSRTILHASDRFVSVAVPGYDFEVSRLLA